jgi:predicted metal-dependent hydrolase
MGSSFDRTERLARLLEQGRVHYACGRFFQAHEAWAMAWREECGSVRLLLQGLILAAAAYHKMGAEEPVGMSILLERALDRLEHLPDGLIGLELDRFRDGLARSLHEALVWRAGGPSPSGPAPLGTCFEPRADDHHAGHGA